MGWGGVWFLPSNGQLLWHGFPLLVHKMNLGQWRRFLAWSLRRGKVGIAEYLPGPGSFPKDTKAPPACSPKLNTEISQFPHYKHLGTREPFNPLYRVLFFLFFFFTKLLGKRKVTSIQNSLGILWGGSCFSSRIRTRTLLNTHTHTLEHGSLESKAQHS